MWRFVALFFLDVALVLLTIAVAPTLATKFLVVGAWIALVLLVVLLVSTLKN